MDNDIIRNPKFAASFLVSKVLEKSLFINELLSNSLNGFSVKDRRFITEIVYGTIRNLRYIDFWIEKAFKKGISKIDSEILSIIRITLYQILFMDNSAEWAATNEAVELVKQTEKAKSSGFVNFLLREIQRIEPSREKLRELVQNEDDEIKIFYSYPDWLFDRFVDKVERHRVEKYLDLANRQIGITLRVEGDEAERDRVIEFLQKENVLAEKSAISQYGIYTHKAVNYDMIKDFKNVYIQDESSQLTVLEMDINPGDTVLDLCAAPGGKTFFISYLTGPSGKVIAADVNRHRIKMITDSILKYKKKNIEIKLQDAIMLREEWIDGFTHVLVDAPCSALGTIRRHPEIKWLKKETDPEKMATLAEKILANGAKYVKKDGILLFAVCTFTKSETTDQIQKFITNNPQFKVEKAYYTIGSATDQRDSFFIAKLRRVK